MKLQRRPGRHWTLLVIWDWFQPTFSQPLPECSPARLRSSRVRLPSIPLPIPPKFGRSWLRRCHLQGRIRPLSSRRHPHRRRVRPTPPPRSFLKARGGDTRATSSRTDAVRREALFQTRGGPDRRRCRLRGDDGTPTETGMSSESRCGELTNAACPPKVAPEVLTEVRALSVLQASSTRPANTPYPLSASPFVPEREHGEPIPNRMVRRG
jgi:hypothetical protein